MVSIKKMKEIKKLLMEIDCIDYDVIVDKNHVEIKCDAFKTDFIVTRRKDEKYSNDIEIESLAVHQEFDCIDNLVIKFATMIIDEVVTELCTRDLIEIVYAEEEECYNE